jgi:hypothetical protein
MPNVRKIQPPDTNGDTPRQTSLPIDAPPAEPKQRGRKPGANGNGKGGKNGSGANLGFEVTLWAAADKLRNNMDAAEYKHVVLGLIFLKYISDAFEERHRWLLEQAATPDSDYYIREERARYQVAEDRDEYSPSISSGCRRRRAGRTSRPTLASRRSVRRSMTRWWRSSAGTRC